MPADLKLKVKPEDFTVEELASLPFKDSGQYSVFRLTKKGWNTVELLRKISRDLKIPYKNFSYGGRKDRHALTSQYITIKNCDKIALKEDNYSLEFEGFTARPMGPDMIEGNKFEVAVRKLNGEEIKSAEKEILKVTKYGYPNYFDDQRFGSFDKDQGFIAEKILKKHYNGALKIYLTSIYSGDKKDEKERKQFLFENWKNWEICLNNAKTDFEETAFESLLKTAKGFLPLIKLIPGEEMSMFISAYQSHLWNELAGEIISQKTGQFSIYKGAVSDYIFYGSLEEKDFKYLEELYLPAPDSRVKMPDELSLSVYNGILEDNGLKPSVFGKMKISQAFFKSFKRKAIIIPGKFSFTVLDDEIYKGKQKLVLKFTLPRGSYGTMLIKRLFSVVKAKI
ncbi:MAG: tRNA pseudouridine(13) synthase TruD [bacterium]